MKSAPSSDAMRDRAASCHITKEVSSKIRTFQIPKGQFAIAPREGRPRMELLLKNQYFPELRFAIPPRVGKPRMELLQNPHLAQKRFAIAPREGRPGIELLHKSAPSREAIPRERRQRTELLQNPVLPREATRDRTAGAQTTNGASAKPRTFQRIDSRSHRGSADQLHLRVHLCIRRRRGSLLEPC